jgi:hypothetical protein
MASSQEAGVIEDCGSIPHLRRSSALIGVNKQPTVVEQWHFAKIPTLVCRGKLPFREEESGASFKRILVGKIRCDKRKMVGIRDSRQ